MARDMLSELRQTRPFELSEEELHLSLIRTADLLGRGFAALLKDRGISGPQYNVLRILRGAGERGLPCGEIAARMVTRDPDVTRLLDRLEHRGLIMRGRGAEDRRVVAARITDAGREMLGELDGPTRALHVRQLGHLPPEAIRVLLDALTGIREHLEPCEGEGGAAAPEATPESAAPSVS